MAKNETLLPVCVVGGLGRAADLRVAPPWGHVGFRDDLCEEARGQAQLPL